MKKIGFTKALTVAVIGAGYLFISSHAGAAGYIKIDGIEGESQLSPGAIDLVSFEFQAAAVGTAAQLSNGGTRAAGSLPAGVVEKQVIHLVKEIDKATPLLYTAMGFGIAAPNMVLTWGDDEKKTSRKYTLRNTKVLSYSTNGVDPDGKALEEYVFTFDHMDMELTIPQMTGDPVKVGAGSGLATGKR